MKTVKIDAQKREELGSKFARRERREERIPGVIYGSKENVHISINELDISKIVYTPDFFKVNVEVDGKSYEVLLKDIQFHPVTDKVTHVDFQELVKGRKIKTEIPIELKGTAAGIQEGGKLQQKLRTLSVRIKPENLIESFDIDVSELELGSSLKVGDLETGEIEVLTPLANPIASVMIPRALKSAVAEAEEGELLEGEEGESTEGEGGDSTAEGGEAKADSGDAQAEG